MELEKAMQIIHGMILSGSGAVTKQHFEALEVAHAAMEFRRRVAVEGGDQRPVEGGTNFELCINRK